MNERPAARKLFDLELECWYDATATEVGLDSLRGERLFRAETPEAVYLVRMMNIRFAVDRGAWKLVGEASPGEARRLYRHVAVVAEADVLDEAPLVGSEAAPDPGVAGAAT